MSSQWKNEVKKCPGYEDLYLFFGFSLSPEKVENDPWLSSD